MHEILHENIEISTLFLTVLGFYVERAVNRQPDYRASTRRAGEALTKKNQCKFQ